MSKTSLDTNRVSDSDRVLALAQGPEVPIHVKTLVESLRPAHDALKAAVAAHDRCVQDRVMARQALDDIRMEVERCARLIAEDLVDPKRAIRDQKSREIVFPPDGTLSFLSGKVAHLVTRAARAAQNAAAYGVEETKVTALATAATKLGSAVAVWEAARDAEKEAARKTMEARTTWNAKWTEVSKVVRASLPGARRSAWLQPRAQKAAVVDAPLETANDQVLVPKVTVAS